MAIAAQALLVAERLGNGLAERDADVFHGVVGIDVQVALGFDFEVDRTVAGDLVEHVVEEGNTSGKAANTGAIKVNFHRDLGLQRIARDFGLSHGFRSGHSLSATRD